MSKTFSKNKDAKELEVPFTMTPNFALDTISMRSPADNCLYFVIIRQTVGYINKNGSRKEKADLSISRLAELTGLSRQGVLNSRRNLYESGWIMYKLFGSMTSYAIIDRYDEFSKKQESTEWTGSSQLSGHVESTELIGSSQLSGHIKEREIKEENKIEITSKQGVSTSLLLEIKAKLKKINENLKTPYIESNKANQKYDIASKSFEGDFDELFQDTLKKLSDLSTRPLDAYSCLRQGVTIESLTAFNCKLIGAIALEHSKKFSKSKLVEVKKEVLPEKEQHEKEIMEFVKYFSGKVPSFPIDKLGKHLQQDQRVIAIYKKVG